MRIGVARLAGEMSAQRDEMIGLDRMSSLMRSAESLAASAHDPDLINALLDGMVDAWSLMQRNVVRPAFGRERSGTARSTPGVVLNFPDLKGTGAGGNV